MTCIVGLVENNVAYIGSDSCGVAGYSITPRADEKSFSVDNRFLIGCTTSFRMIQLLRYKLEVPYQRLDQKDDYRFMVVDFIDSVKKCFAENNFGTPSEGGTFIVAYKSKLYTVENDYQVAMNILPFDSVGCGAEIAKGSLFSTEGQPPLKRVKLALKAASTLNGGVCEPFTILKMEQINEKVKPVKQTKVSYKVSKV